jgi:hypothetical protein
LNTYDIIVKVELQVDADNGRQARALADMLMHEVLEDQPTVANADGSDGMDNIRVGEIHVGAPWHIGETPVSPV